MVSLKHALHNTLHKTLQNTHKRPTTGKNGMQYPSQYLHNTLIYALYVVLETIQRGRWLSDIVVRHCNIICYRVKIILFKLNYYSNLKVHWSHLFSIVISIWLLVIVKGIQRFSLSPKVIFSSNFRHWTWSCKS